MAPLAQLIASSLLLTALSVSADPLHIPLTRRSGRPLDLAEEAHRIRKKYGFVSPNATLPSQSAGPAGKRRAAVVDLPLINQDQDSSFIGTATIGTPPQPFNLILDTGSSDLWVPVTPCQECSLDQNGDFTNNCQQCKSTTPIFQPSSSSSLQGPSSVKGPITISYGSGAVTGTLAADTVTMGGLTIPSQTFLTVSTLTPGILSGTVSGIMGLAFQTIASTRAVPFWQALASGNQLTTPEMSFFLQRANAKSQQQSQPGGTFTLGGTNTSFFTGSIDFNNMPTGTTPSFWLQGLSAVTVNGKSIQITPGNSAISAIDTGTTLIGGPTADVAAIWAAVPGSAAITTGNNAGYYTFPCSSTVSVTLAFGGKAWPISVQDMNLGALSRGSSKCLGAIFDLSQGTNIPANSQNPNWVVGDTFLKNVYSVFRMTPPSVGFAQLSSLAGGSGGPGTDASNTGGSSGSSGTSTTSSATSSRPASFVTFLSLLGAVFVFLL